MYTFTNSRSDLVSQPFALVFSVLRLSKPFRLSWSSLVSSPSSLTPLPSYLPWVSVGTFPLSSYCQPSIFGWFLVRISPVFFPAFPPHPSVSSPLLPPFPSVSLPFVPFFHGSAPSSFCVEVLCLLVAGFCSLFPFYFRVVPLRAFP